MDVSVERIAGTMARDLVETRPAEKGIVLWWLGQAGFAVRFGDFFGLIGPYLSDSLAEKYAGTRKSHDQMMPPPVLPEEVRGLRTVLCSHAHSDHMDPDALGTLARTNPDCAFVVPEAALTVALDRGLPRERVLPTNAGTR